MRIAVIGDLMLDVLVEPDGPLNPGDDIRGRIRMECGGQAANVAAWVTALGGQARLVCAQASDESSVRAARLVSARGVELVGPPVAGRGGVVVSIIEPGGQRSLVSDPGATRSLRPEHVDGGWFAGCGWLHVSGYHLFDDVAADAVLHATGLARSRGARISLDLSYAARLRELGGDEALRRVRRLQPVVIFQTEEEAAALRGPPPAPVCVIKQGADGCTVISDGERFSLPAVAAVAIDTTGAGDAFAAGFLLTGGDDLPSAAEGGLAAAARCVAAVGAMPGDPVLMEPR
ncbi:MAG TPA: PfkB family carbohydrate kinase [Solirubrobacteraceae bacterium]